MCNCIPTGTDRASILRYDICVAESALSKLSIGRRKAAICEPVIKRIKADLRYTLRQEAARVIDLVRAHGKLPYVPRLQASEAGEEEHWVTINGAHVLIGGDNDKAGGRTHKATGLPLNSDGTVTLYHGTTKAAAREIVASGKLRSAGEPDIYLTTDPKGGDYGDGTVVKVNVWPDQLKLDDEFPGGRKDFRISVGKPGGEITVHKVTRAARRSAIEAAGSLYFSDIEGMMALIRGGQTLGGYESLLEDAYREVMPGASDAAIKQVLDAAGIRYRVSKDGAFVMLSGAQDGLTVLRPAQAAIWTRDHAIQFGRTWAPKVMATTNKAIRAQLAQGMDAGEPISKLAERIQSVYADASDYRADMIARAETSRGYNSAQIETGRRLGVAGKHWIISGSPYSLVDVCADNAGLGQIGLDQSFDDTDGDPIEAPPGHPNCTCNVGLDVQDDYEVPDSMLEAA